MRIAGISFDHMHMGDLLRMVHEHPSAEIVGICDEDPSKMKSAIVNFKIPSDRVFTDYRECLDQARPDLVILCAATGEHRRWTEQIAEYRVHVCVEKPFAANLNDADAMISAMQRADRLLAINWPMRWDPAYISAKRLIDEGTIGEVIEFHHYGGNRGPLLHGADKVEASPTTAEKAENWFYKRKLGGGSLLDYGGYGATIGTWMMNGKRPLEVTCTTHNPSGLEVDEQSVTVLRYEHGLSKIETRWGTFTDPWTHQPQPRCGFVLVGTEGTISVYDYATTIRVQTRDDPAGSERTLDQVLPPYENPVQYLTHCIQSGQPVTGPLSLEIARIGQQIIDTAVQSAAARRTLPLIA